jgi:Arc/MetJ-type ribon-helix-helix transcriptional regulator
MILPMNAKLSVSVDPSLIPFIDHYQTQHAVKTKSEVVERALRLLRDAELEESYAAAANDWQESEDAVLWDKTSNDGLSRD